MNRPPSSALAVRRTLRIIRTLQREPLDRAALEAHIRATEGEDAYSTARRAARKAFEGDLERAVEQFGVQIRYDRQARCYRLHDLDESGWFDLPDEALDALALVHQTFDGRAPGGERVRAALEALYALLPEERRALLHARRRTFVVALRGLDAEIDPALLDRLADALARRQVIRFTHRSPRHPSHAPLRYEVEPHTLRHDEEHWYLHGFARWVEDADGRRLLNKERRFRVSYILPDSVEVLAEKLPVQPRRARPFRLRYRLHPDIACGEISHRFEGTEISLRDDGWAEVTATARDPFKAAQSLMRYADKCVVLEPPEVVDLIRSWLWGMMALYELDRPDDEAWPDAGL